jgi:hypothetical protein
VSAPPAQAGARVDAWGPADTAAKGETVAVPVFIDVGEVGKAIGSYGATLAWDTAVAEFVSLSRGDFQGSFDSNQPAVDSISFAGVNTDSGANLDTTKVAELSLEVTGEGGDQTALNLTVKGLSATDFTDLTSDVGVTDGSLSVATGVWGDPNKDKKIEALDALICLSHVVGKDLPSDFDATFCDVAPDGDDNTFTGEISALDALGILSDVVGKALPEHFRVGDPR